MELGSKVQLGSFNGTVSAPKSAERDPASNYWKLIGKRGVVMSMNPPKGITTNRILVRFDCDVRAKGLHCHNEIENSLWILKQDLIELSDASKTGFTSGISDESV